MAKIVRYGGNLKAFASEQQTNERTLFGQVTIANDLTSQITAQFLRGWGIVGPSDQPSLQDFNAAMYTHGQLLAYLHQMGVAEYNATQEYFVGSLTQTGGVLYMSLSDANIGNSPSTSPASWKSLAPAVQATEVLAGIAALASQSEALAGTNDTKAMTALKVKQAIAAQNLDLLNTQRIDVASAATINLTTSAPNTRNINITGTTAITGFTVTAGKLYFVRFDGVLTLTNGAGIVTQSGANITTAAGDTCAIRATASNVVEVMFYTPGIPQEIGYRQSIQSFTSPSRQSGVTYTNTTGRAILAIILVGTGLASSAMVDGKPAFIATVSGGGQSTCWLIIPAGLTYSITTSQINGWLEYRT